MSADWDQVNSRHSCPSHRRLGFALARELGCGDERLLGADAKLDAIALTLADARLPGDPEAELIETGRVLDDWLISDTQGRKLRADFADLTLPDVLRAGHGHETAVIAAALAACDRAGMRFGVVASERHLYLAHLDLTKPYVLAPRYGWRFVEATDLREGKLIWMCPHELAMRTLDQIHERATICNLVDVQLKVSQLRVDMPMDKRTRRGLQTELAMARARFN